MFLLQKFFEMSIKTKSEREVLLTKAAPNHSEIIKKTSLYGL